MLVENRITYHREAVNDDWNILERASTDYCFLVDFDIVLISVSNFFGGSSFSGTLDAILNGRY